MIRFFIQLLIGSSSQNCMGRKCTQRFQSGWSDLSNWWVSITFEAWINRIITTSAWIRSPTVGHQNQTVDPVYIRSRRAWPSFERRPCSAPRQPVNGNWKMRREFCRDTFEDCYILEGTELQPTTQLIYSCKPGFVIKGNSDVICQAWGTWTPLPVCTRK